MAWTPITLGEYRRANDAMTTLHGLYHEVDRLVMSEGDRKAAKTSLIAVERILTKAKSKAKEDAES